MQTKDTLGIVVNSNKYFESVVLLAQAAADQDKAVHIHLLGSGCQFAMTDACARIGRHVRITMCATSADETTQGAAVGTNGRIALVPPQALTRLLEQCDRYVVF
jgi:hypothetical protein